MDRFQASLRCDSNPRKPRVSCSTRSNCGLPLLRYRAGEAPVSEAGGLQRALPPPAHAAPAWCHPTPRGARTAPDRRWRLRGGWLAEEGRLHARSLSASRGAAPGGEKVQADARKLILHGRNWSSRRANARAQRLSYARPNLCILFPFGPESAGQGEHHARQSHPNRNVCVSMRNGCGYKRPCCPGTGHGHSR